MNAQVLHCDHLAVPAALTKPEFQLAAISCRMCFSMLCPGMRDSH